MADQTESASEYAELLKRSEHTIRRVTNGITSMRVPVDPTDADIVIRDLQDAIRALEAKVAVLTGLDSYGAAKIEELRADRDRIAAELRGTQTRMSEIAGEVERIKSAANVEIRRLRQEALNLDAEVARLAAELAKARENEARYLVVRDVTPAEADTFNAAKNAEQFDQAADAIIAARSARAVVGVYSSAVGR